MLFSVACKKQPGTVAPPVVIVPPVPPPIIPASILNTTHLEKLVVPIVFANGDKAEGIYIYADAPNYNPTIAGGEGFTCVDDVARVVLFYLRSPSFSTDTLVQNKVFGMLRCITNMQSDNGYCYNFLQRNPFLSVTG